MLLKLSQQTNFKPGEDDDEYPEDEEHEEAESDLPKVRRLRAKEKKATLLDTIEPSELEEKLLSPMDKRIQLEDRPERFQVNSISIE